MKKSKIKKQKHSNVIYFAMIVMSSTAVISVVSFITCYIVYFANNGKNDFNLYGLISFCIYVVSYVTFIILENVFLCSK